jgi:hypothetical protein
MTLTHKHLPILEAARALIDSGKQHYICFAIHNAIEGRAEGVLARDIRAVIEEGIAPFFLLSTWLVKEVCPGTPTRDLPPQYFDGYMNEDGILHLARLAWLDRLIANIKEN